VTLVMKELPGSAGGYEWPNAADIVEVPEPLAVELLRIGGFTEIPATLTAEQRAAQVSAEQSLAAAEPAWPVRAEAAPPVAFSGWWTALVRVPHGAPAEPERIPTEAPPAVPARPARSK
jgi:hypothetical protein